ncbi:MAG: hypothetical protein ACI8ZM_003821 [Crocinitomix sp.]|jgi:hypothetical protein
MENIFDQAVNNRIVERINTLTLETQPSWGKMDVAQMLAHCSVAYDGIYDDARSPVAGFKKFLLKLFVKKIVVSDKSYKKNSRTAPEFLIVDKRDFKTEKERLVKYLNKTQELGAEHFDGKASHSFGPLTRNEWNNMFYKHLDHHLKQFGA